MIIATGDLHGDWGPLNNLMNKKKPDVVFVCGDFGWWPKLDVNRPVLYTKQAPWNHKGLKVPKNTTVYWCDGNHEDHESINELVRAASFYVHGCGGIAVYPGVVYMPRGHTICLPDGRVVLFFGGAYSVDKDIRTPGRDWFSEEIPSYQQFETAMSHTSRIDIVVSHTAPTEWIPNVLHGEKFRDSTRGMLSEILQRYRPKLWYHGHWHTRKTGRAYGTEWHSLDYPKHGNTWWVEVK